MSHSVAYTAPGTSYPGFVNLTRNEDGTYTLTVRGDPEAREGIHVCGQTCLPGGPTCNNYCNLAPAKGPMQPSPERCTHVKCGEQVTITLTGEALDALGWNRPSG